MNNKGLNEFLNILKPTELKEFSQISDLPSYFMEPNDKNVEITGLK